MAKLNIPQLNRVISVDPKKTLMDNIIENNIPVASSCGGDGICGKCKMKIMATSELQPLSELERRTLEKNQGEPNERLSCQIHLKQNAMAETNYW
ncbi:MAG: 2Fe-2S iron-sulfur cluster binding domain-containing protein [Bdellovibrionales bacterium]|nr:2Fe-2S iron-sulfur cluster-binding protein [Bdellovibrionales bacterium]NQZ19033.1 2Fe-2S iron-sulfur cluster binding domain-containing protein [Bdellovibrionales bacterium]